MFSEYIPLYEYEYQPWASSGSELLEASLRPDSSDASEKLPQISSHASKYSATEPASEERHIDSD